MGCSCISNKEINQQISRHLPELRFNPWIGDSYSNSELFGKKILIVGESQYIGNQYDQTCEPNRCHNCEAIKEYTSGTNYRFYGGITKVLIDTKELSNRDRANVWDNLAFYNYINTFVGGARVRPSKKEWDEGKKIFLEMLGILKPEIVVVAGKGLWGHVPDGKLVHRDKVDFDIHCYDIGGNNFSYAIYINHPSSVGFDCLKWGARVKDLLKILSV